MSEAQILRRIRKLAQTGKVSGGQAVIQGIGDDCAVVRPEPNTDLVFTTDFLIEDRHFRLADHSAGAIGQRALARSLSDLAAMGSEPLFCLVSLALPASLASRWLSGFYTGLTRVARKYNLALAGGDLAQTTKVIADVMCCGKVPKGKALLRSGARPGDAVYVTGRLGKPWILPPAPRISEGIALRGIATAVMDISDGLSLDLQRLCLESGVSAELDSSAIPIYRGATLDRALHGGEDYELVFTAPPDAATAFHRIGVIASAQPGRLFLDGKRLRAQGFDHFKSAKGADARRRSKKDLAGPFRWRA